MPARQTVAQVYAGNVGTQLLKAVGARVAVNAGALEQVDQQFMNGIDVDTGFDIVPAVSDGNNV